MATATKPKSKRAKLEESAGRNAEESLGVRSKGAVPASKVIRGVSAPAKNKGLTMLREGARIPLDLIVSDIDQPRTKFDDEALERLKDTIQARGLLQPIGVRRIKGTDRYKIVFGERRWRACVALGWESIPAIIREQDEPDPLDVLLDQLVENEAREDLSPIEQAHSFKRLIDGRGMSGRQLAAELGISQPSVSRALALLDLPDEIQELVEAGSISAASGYELSKVEDEAEQIALANRIVTEGLSRSEARDVIRGESPAPVETPTPTRPGVIRGESPAPSDPVDHGDWTKLPISTLVLRRAIFGKLHLAGLDTVGLAWAKVEDGSLAEMNGWTVADAKAVEQAIVELRDEAGDPAPCTEPLPQPADWRDRLLINDPGCFSEMRKAAEAIGIMTFGQLEKRFAEGTTDRTFDGFGGLLWSLLNRAKGAKATAYKPVEVEPESDGRGVPGRPSPAPVVEETRPDSGLPDWSFEPFGTRRMRKLASIEGVDILARADSIANPGDVLLALEDAVMALKLEMMVLGAKA